MKAWLYHVQLNVGDAARSLPFYRDLFDYFEYRVLLEAPGVLGVTNGTTDVWLIETPRDRRGASFHRENVGVNHLAFGVGRREDVDAFVAESCGHGGSRRSTARRASIRSTGRDTMPCSSKIRIV